MQRLQSESSILQFITSTDPADHYLVKFHGVGVWRSEVSNRIEVRHSHEVRIILGAGYPRMMPELHWQTPIFHPNVSASGIVCLGGYGTHWVPSLSLDELCEMLWDMVRYKNFDPGSPYNREAAMWARSQTDYRLPLDNRSLRDLIARGVVAPGGNRPASAKKPAGEVLFLDEVVDAEPVDEPTQRPKTDDVLFIE